MRSASAETEFERYLVVRVSGRLCALPLAAVIEVLRAPPLDADGAGSHGLEGFATLRGEATAVFSLASLIGLQESAAAEAGEQRAVRIRLAGATAALLVDEVIGLNALRPEQLTRIALPGGEERAMGRFDEDFAAIVELGGLLPSELPEAPPATLPDRERG